MNKYSFFDDTFPSNYEKLQGYESFILFIDSTIKFF